MTVKVLSNSGWGADLAHAVDGLLYAVTHRVPVELYLPVPWQYTTGRRHQDPVCPTADLDCYFLAHSNCSTKSRRSGGPLEKAHFWVPWKGFLGQASWQWMILQYATRAQTWLRHKAVDLAATVPLPTPCAVVHVRRADVVLHGRFSRRYHKIAEYMSSVMSSLPPQQQRQLGPHILLLTDDANAIAEALAYNRRHNLHYQWHYFDRPRHKGPEGGWENQIPSTDPEWEVVVLHATFLLIRRCNLLVHSKSNLADYYYAVMSQANAAVQRIDLDASKSHEQIHNAQNAETVRVSSRFN